MNLKGKKVFVAGSSGMAGSAIVRKLREENEAEVIATSRDEVDLLKSSQVDNLFSLSKPDIVINAAAKVGGILANRDYPTEFLLENLEIQNNLVKCALAGNVGCFVFLGSSCIYPKFAKQPIREEYLLEGSLEPTNKAYALAKIAGLELVDSIRRQYGRNYFSVMPTNLYGPGDYFHPEKSHVIPSLIRKFVSAKQANSASVTVWGTGEPRREFLHVEDCASAIVHLIKIIKLDSFEDRNWMDSHINIGTGQDITIKEVANLTAELVGFEGKITFDTSKPDGTPRKLLDTQRLNTLGWKSSIELPAGLKSTIEWYLDQESVRR